MNVGKGNLLTVVVRGDNDGQRREDVQDLFYRDQI